jgi:hypothetical protein
MLPCVNDFINLARIADTPFHHAKCFHNIVSFCPSLCLSVYLYVNIAAMFPPEAHRQHSCSNPTSVIGTIFTRMQVDL